MKLSLNTIKALYIDNVWNILFHIRLYDFLVMSSYRESLKTIALCIKDFPHKHITDIGCGTGLLLEELKLLIRDEHVQYTGIDQSGAGISITEKRGRKLEISSEIKLIQADISGDIPPDINNQDIVGSHFSLYVIRKKESRIKALKNINSMLKPSGILFIAVPGPTYDAKTFLKSSLEINRRKGMPLFQRYWNAFVYRIFCYPAEKTAVNYVKKGIWMSYTRDSLQDEIGSAGFTIKETKKVYGDTSLLAICNKR